MSPATARRNPRPIPSGKNLFPKPLYVPNAERRARVLAAAEPIRALFQAYCDQESIPGLVYGVVAEDELVLAEALGMRELESQSPVTLDTVFRIASMTKSLVAMAILCLRDDQRLRLDEPVAKYVPELKGLVYPTADSPELTIRHLLTMTPGFPEDNPWGDRQMAITDATFRRRLLAGIPFSNAPGIEYEYSNYGYSILGRIVSRVSGMRFQDYITRQILKPLGMHATVWDKRRVPPDRLAIGYRRQENPATGAFEFDAQPILPDGAFAAMAGLFTTVADFARYMVLLMDAYPPRDDPEGGPVRRATAREMQQLARFETLVERKLADGSVWHAVSGYGYGLAVWHDERLGHGISHGGGLPGYGSYYYCLPQRRVGVVAMTNKTGSRIGNIFPEVLAVLDRAGALQPPPIVPSERLVQIAARVQSWLEGGADSELEAIAADNFFLDSDLAHRSAARARYRALVGSTLQVGKLRPLNALRGTWRIECERGWLDVLITLAPTMPPLLQSMVIVPGQPA